MGTKKNRSITNLCAFMLAAALIVAGCGGGGGGGEDPPMMPEPTAQETCEAGGDRYNADGTCTSAAELVMERQEMQRNAITTAIGAATTAVNAVNNDSTDAQVSAADTAIANARTAIADAADLPAAETAANTGTVNALETLLSGAKQDRMDAMNEADRAAREAMAATAAKLYAGISAPMGDVASPAPNDRAARYDITNATTIEVTIGTADAAGPVITLSEDKDTMVAANHGWAGKRYADSASGGMVEAYVYSNVQAPTMGKKFGGASAGNEFEYTLVEGALNEANGLTDANADKVALTGVTRTAGTETFMLPDPNPNRQQLITVPGSFHGVSGTYSCDTGAARDLTCSAMVAATGFTLTGTGTWTFRPGNANARVTDAADTAYASYGWWLRKAANDGPFTASAFVDVKGTVTRASGINILNGTATYMGGAAGKYALASSTGGTNDAGHFTARATLKADFTNNTAATAITGTLDMFMGADGEARDWSVKLNGSPITDTGGIGDATMGTEWTIGGTAAADSGSWSGSLLNQPADGDGVPQVATGTFYTEYGTAGRMVGAFGANRQ